jgi:hypothetical protein
MDKLGSALNPSQPGKAGGMMVRAILVFRRKGDRESIIACTWVTLERTPKFDIACRSSGTDPIIAM